MPKPVMIHVAGWAVYGRAFQYKYRLLSFSQSRIAARIAAKLFRAQHAERRTRILRATLIVAKP